MINISIVICFKYILFKVDRHRYARNERKFDALRVVDGTTWPNEVICRENVICVDVEATRRETWRAQSCDSESTHHHCRGVYI